MRWYLIAAVFIAVLACPLIANYGDCESNVVELPDALLEFDESDFIITRGDDILKSNDTVYLGDIIKITPAKENFRVLFNGDIIDNDTYIGKPFAFPSKYFDTDTGKIIVEAFIFGSITFEFLGKDIGLEAPGQITGFSIFDTVTLPNFNHVDAKLKEWSVIKGNENYSFLPGDKNVDRDFMNLFSEDSTILKMYGLLDYTEYIVSLNANGGIIEDTSWVIDNGDYVCNYTRVSDDIILPDVVYDWQYEFVSWIDEENRSYKTVNTHDYNNLVLNASKKLKDYTVHFYYDSDLKSIISSKTLTSEFFETPDEPNKYFKGWYYTNQNDECEFTKNTVLQDNMNVYAKYIPTYTINYYDSQDDCINQANLLESRTFTDSYFENPVNSNKYFINWFYKDQNGNECVFEKGVDLQEQMDVYAKYIPTYKINFYDDCGDCGNPDKVLESRIFTDTYFEVPVNSNEYFINWFYKDQNGNECEFKQGIDLQKEMDVYAKYKKVYNIHFYERTGSEPMDKKLTDDHFEVPDISDEKFVMWYYRDKNDVKHEFNKDTVLQDDMNVYAEYEGETVITENDTGGSGSTDTDLYRLLTENGISISDNEIVESVAASVIFVILALSTFLFVFRRH